MVACKPDQYELPPRDAGWRAQSRGRWQVDYLGFRRLQKKNDVKKAPEEEEVERELTIVDLTKLKGAVEGRDPETCTYFAHFFVLLTLEHLTELRGFRSRWAFRTSDELVTFGLCFKDVYVD